MERGLYNQSTSINRLIKIAPLIAARIYAKRGDPYALATALNYASTRRIKKGRNFYTPQELRTRSKLIVSSYRNQAERLRRGNIVYVWEDNISSQSLDDMANILEQGKTLQEYPFQKK
jgi:hypothetical protein